MCGAPIGSEKSICDECFKTVVTAASESRTVTYAKPDVVQPERAKFWQVKHLYNKSTKKVSPLRKKIDMILLGAALVVALLVFFKPFGIFSGLSIKVTANNSSLNVDFGSFSLSLGIVQTDSGAGTENQAVN